MNIKLRIAQYTDIPFIIRGILEIEEVDKSNTYNRLFETSTKETIEILTSFFEDEENKGTEVSLDTFLVADIDGVPVGFCSLIYTDQKYYQSKGELFPMYLTKKQLDVFLKKASKLPDSKKYSENKYFIEYIFVDENYRKKGIAERMIREQENKMIGKSTFINVFENKKNIQNYYEKLGYSIETVVPIDTVENEVYPSINKVVMKKDGKG